MQSPHVLHELIDSHGANFAAREIAAEFEKGPDGREYRIIRAASGATGGAIEENDEDDDQLLGDSICLEWWDGGICDLGERSA